MQLRARTIVCNQPQHQLAVEHFVQRRGDLDFGVECTATIVASPLGAKVSFVLLLASIASWYYVYL